MNKIDKPVQFDTESIRDAVKNGERVGEANVAPSELNRLAQQTARRLAQDSFSPSMIIGLLRMAEFALLALVGIAIYGIYVGISTEMTLIFYIPTILAGSAIAVLFLQIADCYQVPAVRRAIKTFPRVLIAWTAAFAVLAVLGFFLQYSLVFSRLLVCKLVSCRYCRVVFCQDILVLCHSPVGPQWHHGAPRGHCWRWCNGRSLIRSIEQEPDNDIRIVRDF